MEFANIDLWNLHFVCEFLSTLGPENSLVFGTLLILKIETHHWDTASFRLVPFQSHWTLLKRIIYQHRKLICSFIQQSHLPLFSIREVIWICHKSVLVVNVTHKCEKKFIPHTMQLKLWILMCAIHLNNPLKNTIKFIFKWLIFLSDVKTIVPHFQSQVHLPKKCFFYVAKYFAWSDISARLFSLTSVLPQVSLQVSYIIYHWIVLICI